MPLISEVKTGFGVGVGVVLALVVVGFVLSKVGGK
jgi:flagellar biosynthesis protein FliP